MKLFNQWLIFYCSITSIIPLYIFISGFFPLKAFEVKTSTMADIPTEINNHRVTHEHIYAQFVKKAVIMVVDALRFDFIQSNYHPFLSTLIKQNFACMYPVKVFPPTVTLPRIKAITTGGVPSFIDVVMNFGSNQIHDDSLLHQATSFGMNITFFGDDTWLKLFPGFFIRSDGTTSFFVTDFHEVDDNITRHIDEEFSRDDWSIMILHYLGLDHIGHIEGPKGQSVPFKLLEMDSVIQKLHNHLFSRTNQSADKSVLLICGDHGMKDSGGHGGGSLEETVVPVVIAGIPCLNPPNSLSDMKDTDLAQIDIVPTLSTLLGLPIPSSNLGKLIPGLLKGLSPQHQLFALHYNAKQLAEKCSEQNEDFLKAVELHSNLLNLEKWKEDDYLKIRSLYISALARMSSVLTQSVIEYDMYSIGLSIFFLLQNLVIIVALPHMKEETKIPIVISLISGIFILFFHYFTCMVLEFQTNVCEYSTNALLLTFAFGALMAHNFRIFTVMFKSGFTINAFCCNHTNVLILGSLLQVLSFGSSSLIEEEHQTWYFMWTTFCLLTSVRAYLSSRTSSSFKMLIQNSGVMFLCRFLRKLNQTGDKWAAIPDIGDWLTMSEHRNHLSLFALVGLVVVIVSCFIVAGYVDTSFQLIDIMLWCVAATCIYCYRTATGSLETPISYPQSRGYTEVYIFWTVLALICLRRITYPWSFFFRKSYKSCPLQNLNSFFSVLTICFLLLSSVLHRPHNIILPGLQVIITKYFHGSLPSDFKNVQNNITWLCFVHIWIGMVFFFYQGNSNSLASVDVAAGYVGQQDYNPITVGLLLLVNTYSAPLLSYLLLLTRIAEQRNQLDELHNLLTTVFYVYITIRLITTSWYCALVTLQRHHLFVWTVFSPKLLYEIVHTLVVTTIVGLTKLIRSHGFLSTTLRQKCRVQSGTPHRLPVPRRHTCENYAHCVP